MFQSKYVRLPSKDPRPKEMKFDALDGPSFYSYGIQQGKYKSLYTYAQFGKENSRLESSKPSIFCQMCSAVATLACYVMVVLTLPLSLVFSLKYNKSYEKMVLFRLGRYLKTSGPGYQVVLPCIDSWNKVDMRMKAFSVPPQKVITTDNAVIEIGADIFYNVMDPLKSVGRIQDLNHSTRIICQTSLAKHVGRRKLSDIETCNQTIKEDLKDDVNMTTRTWGVEVRKVELSSPKLYSKPTQTSDQSNNPLSLLGPVLFPPGSSNPPLEQLQHYFGLNAKDQNEEARDKMRGDWKKIDKTIVIEEGNTEENLKSLRDLNIQMDQFITLVTPKLNNNIVKDIQLIYKFIVIPDNESLFHKERSVFFLDLKNGDGKVGREYPYSSEPEVCLTLNRGTMKDLLNQRVSPFNAFIDGRLTVHGDLRGAMKLGNLIEVLRKN